MVLTPDPRPVTPDCLIMKFLLLIALCVMTHPAPAQDTLSVAADTLFVTAVRTERPVFDVPYAIDVRSADGLPRAEAHLSLAEVLRTVPGLVVDDRQNLSQGDRITMRGIGARAAFGVRGIQVVLDGIPLTMPDGQAQLNNIDMSSIARVEVLRGPSSALYGNAAGGVILLHSAESASDPLRVRPSLTMGSYGLRRAHIAASAAADRHQVALSAYHLAANGYRDFSEARTIGLNLRTRHGLSDHLALTVVVHHVDSPYLLNPSTLDKTAAETARQSARAFVQQQGSGKILRQTQGGVSLHYRASDLQVQSAVYGVDRSLYNPIPGRVIDLDRIAGGWRTVIVLPRSAFHWTAGLDVETQRDLRREYLNNGLSDTGIPPAEVIDRVQRGDEQLHQRETVTGFGPFARLSWMPHSRWRTEAGIRFDRYVFRADDRFLIDGTDDSGQRTMQQWSSSLGLTYRPAPLLSLYANLSTAFQTPTTTELSNRPDGARGFHPDLQPEKFRSLELGAKGGTRQVSYDLAAYHLHIRNLLIPFQGPTEEIFYRNAGKARNIGFEACATWTPIAGVRAEAAYAHQRFTFRDFVLNSGHQLAGNRVPGIAPHRIAVGLALSHPTGPFAELHIRGTSRMFANDFNGPPPDSAKLPGDFVESAHVIADLRLGFARRAFTCHLGLNNVFDTRYNGSLVPNAIADRFFEPAAGRNLHAGVSIEIP